MEKAERLARLRAQWESCTLCPLHERGGPVIFGEGNENASLMIIADAPKYADAKEKTPLSGRLGEILDMFLGGLNSSRDEVYITYLVACRTPDEQNPKASSRPSAASVKACSTRVRQILETVDPYVVLLLGEQAFKALSPENTKLSKVAESKQVYDVRVETQGVFAPVVRTAFATWSLPYLATNWTWKKGGPVAQAFGTWEQAFRVADEFSELYRGIAPPMRETQP